MTWETKKLAHITLQLWKEAKICGLFLSSSVSKDPDDVTELQLEVLRTLRSMRYTGYIHLRLMPGVSRHYVKEAVELADRVGINLEAPNRAVFDELCPNKGGFNEAVLKRLTWVVDETERAKRRRESIGVRFGYGRAGVDTQMIVGAVDDNDWQYLQVTEWLYKRNGLKRVYYSGFDPIAQTPLEKRKACPPSREHRLYQCSFLIRDYGFKTGSIAQIVNDDGFLPNSDPKLALANANRDMFPIDLNAATYFEIVQIPRVGPLTAKKILAARRNFKINRSADLERVVGAKLARRIRRYVDLRDKKLTDF
jgi:predicted DNA-binding helix-hairpin-helix protein